MIDEDRAPFVFSILNDSSQAAMCRPMGVLDRYTVMVIAVVVIMIVVVGRGEVDVRRRKDRRPDGGQHQNRGEERTPLAVCAHGWIMRVSRTRVNPAPALRDAAGQIKPNRTRLVIVAI